MAYQNGDKFRIEQRRHEAVQMKIAGRTVRQIGEHFGISHVQAQRDVKHVLEEWAKENRGNANRIHALEMARYNRLLERWWPVALGDDPEAAMKASEFVLKILKQIDVINGIIPDKPLINLIDARTQTVNNYGDPRERLQREIARVIAAAQEDDKSLSDGEAAG